MISFALILSLFAPVQWMVDLLHPVLLFFHDTIGVGWGMSIVLLTVVVRALLAPLAVKQFKSAQSMVRVAPQLKALQAKHSDDKQRQQQEVVKFYADNKINPFASCLPLVAQIPFFIGLYALLQTDLKVDICGKAAAAASKTPCAQIAGARTGNEDFLFISDLTVKATGWVLALLIVLYISSQLLSSLLTPSTAGRNQRLIMYGLPFVFVIVILRFPAGLIVYWITTNPVDSRPGLHPAKTHRSGHCTNWEICTVGRSRAANGPPRRALHHPLGDTNWPGEERRRHARRRTHPDRDEAQFWRSQGQRRGQTDAQSPAATAHQEEALRANAADWRSTSAAPARARAAR